MDPASQAVFGALVLNVIVSSLIVFGWLLIRKKRGDKSAPKDHRDSLLKPSFGRLSVMSGKSGIRNT
jgi:hypothetical protein